MRILFIFLITWCFVFAGSLKVLSILPFGEMNLKITFQNPVQEKDFRIRKNSHSRGVIEFHGALTPFAKKKYLFPKDLSILIAQISPNRVRILITSDKNTNYKLRFAGKNLYISFTDEIPLLKEKSHKNTKASSKKEDSKGREKESTGSKDSKNTKESQSSKEPAKPSADKSSVSKEPAKPQKQTYRIVVDPGHGGKDCGSMGVNKVCEKVIVLDVAKFVEEELKKRGYTIYMTRSSDVFVDLKKRTEMANIKNAHLFISIHANSVNKGVNPKTDGIETYFLSMARSERARNVAEKENKGDVETMNYFSKLSFLNTLSSHRLIASNKLAIDIQFNILHELRKQYKNVIDGGVREGPFWVLAGALMPSVLIEIGYNSNEMESRRLNDKEYQKSLAIGIANGIDSFIAKNF